ncbi:RINT-1 family protein [Cladophialophora carrionii]|uniref:RINT-1 family protein n=1 Tax=Cladophialophora carrionii TaxID=86049 RepID=A0A1C1CMY3_9EURO|nr:RINT-1 family protein [Cladophialophora carrionii]
MAELQLSKTGDVRTRVDDYLTDKIQTAADLDQVDSLLQRVQEQQDLLRKQLDDARKDLTEAQKRVDERSDELRTKAEAYQREQAQLNERLHELTSSPVSGDAAQKFEARMSKVRSLEIAQAYLEMVQQMNTLNDEARSRLSVKAYNRIRALWKHVQDAQTVAEGAAPQLVYLFEQTSKQLYDTLRAALENELRQTLEQMKWPGKELSFSGRLRQEWEEQTRRLLELQDPDLVEAFADIDIRNRSAAPDPVVLLPLEVMVQPLAVRFRYHFYGDKPTNRLDKPEYFLTHILDVLERHSGFMNDMLGPILDERAVSSEALESIYTDATSAFITALLPMVEAKCLSFLPQISRQPQLLSHFLHELMAFDTTLRETWGYVPIPRMVAEWKGLTWRILNTHGYFDTWLRVEKDFALSRYRSIRDAPDSNDIDFDAETGQTKPTKGAIRVNDLLETITDRYRSLSSFSQKMKFLLEIQLSIFDDYHSHLHGALQAYLVSSHTAGRLLQGQSEAEAFGLKGLESLAKVFGSAEFLERKMSDWSDDVFFLELWDELQYRAKANSGHDASVGTGLRVEDVAEKTSTAIKANGTKDGGGGGGDNDNDVDADLDGSGLFDQTASAYRRLRERSEEEMLRFFDVNLKAALRPYAKFAQWSSLAESPSDLSAMPPSSSLDSFFTTTATLLGYLSRVLAPGSQRRIIKHYCLALQREIYDNVLMHHTFSAAGAAQFARDLSEIKASIEKQSKIRAAAGGNLRRLEEAVYLLSLDASKDGGNVEDDGWGFDDDDDDDKEGRRGTGDDGNGKSLGLWEAERHIFESNEAARKALAEMGLVHLSEGEARNVLKRRVELNGL